MDWVEVPPAEWQAFLGRFTDEHRGWRAAIEFHAPGHIPERFGEGFPLRRIGTEPSDSRHTSTAGDDIEIISDGELTSNPTGEFQHRVERPSHLRFARSPYFSDVAVHIESTGRPATVLHVWTNTGRDRDGKSLG